MRPRPTTGAASGSSWARRCGTDRPRPPTSWRTCPPGSFPSGAAAAWPSPSRSGVGRPCAPDPPSMPPPATPRASSPVPPTATAAPPAIGSVILASSLGTLFEWYDFYLYGSLAVFFGNLFFPPGNERAALLASLATFGAGFGVRPLGAVVFGRVGDLVGRKYTFVVTMVTMGLSTALIGFLPTYARVGLLAPV